MALSRRTTNCTKNQQSTKRDHYRDFSIFTLVLLCLNSVRDLILTMCRSLLSPQDGGSQNFWGRFESTNGNAPTGHDVRRDYDKAPSCNRFVWVTSSYITLTITRESLETTVWIWRLEVGVRNSTIVSFIQQGSSITRQICLMLEEADVVNHGGVISWTIR